MSLAEVELFLLRELADCCSIQVPTEVQFQLIYTLILNDSFHTLMRNYKTAAKVIQESLTVCNVRG